jgi:Transposase IS4
MSHAVFKQYWRYLLFPGFVDDIPESSEVPVAPEPHEFGGSLYYVAMRLIRSFNE